MNKSLVSATLLALTIGVGTAFAQAPAGRTASGPDKAAISKACSDQANAKGLHGKARKKFRSQCKRAGGKAM